MSKKNLVQSAPPAPPAAAPRAEASAELWTVPCVARDLGVPVEFVQELFDTQCAVDVHYVLVRGVAVFNEAGVDRIRQAIAANMRGTVEPTATPTPAAAPSIQGEDLRLTRVFRWSTNVLAERANGLEVVVKVKDVTHLEAGMVLQGCVPGDCSWFYMGRLPKSIGQRQLYFPPSKPRRTSSNAKK